MAWNPLLPPPANAQPQQMTWNPLSLTQPVRNDASGYYVDVGDEPERPVFSDKEFRQQMLWNQMQNMRSLYSMEQSPERLAAYNAAWQAYSESLSDPGLPAAQAESRGYAEQAQGSVDANLIQQAMDARARLGRR